ncbi:unnamed protein product, partial [Prorocentrum cordatum]
AGKTFEALEKAMTKTENAESAFRQALAIADVSKQALGRAMSRIFDMGGLIRVRGRKAVGVVEHAVVLERRPPAPAVGTAVKERQMDAQSRASIKYDRTEKRGNAKVEENCRKFTAAKTQMEDAKAAWMSSICDRLAALVMLSDASDALDRIKAERAPR